MDDIDSQYNEGFYNLSQVEQMIVIEYLSGKSVYRIAKDKHYDKDYMCHAFRKAIGKLVNKRVSK